MAYSNINPLSKKTPQSKPAPGKDMVKGRAGGYVFQADDWDRLDRFLILGSDSNTYYATGKELTAENANVVLRLLREDGLKVVERIRKVSASGRAPRNSPALYALAVAITYGDVETRRAAGVGLLAVARTASHLFEWVSYVKQMRGFGRVVKRAVENWYNSRSPDALAYQMTKYQNRYGWTHTDLIRMARPEPATDAHDRLFAWAVEKDVDLEQLPEIVTAVEAINASSREEFVVNAVKNVGLTREMVPTNLLNSLPVWEALLPGMPPWALVRNLGKMTSIGLVGPGTEATKTVVARLTDEEYLSRGRMHPLAILQAMSVYRSGSGFRGSLRWDPHQRVIDALDAAFYLTFGNVSPIGNRVLIGLDVSSSMGWGAVAGMEPVTPSEGAAAMCLVTARTEADWEVLAFQRTLTHLPISPRQRLDDVIKLTANMTFGGTDCSQPIVYALENGVSVDTFIVYTDNETWAGRIHPFQALDVYRQKTGIPAKLVVVGMTSNGFTIADPDDAGMMDVVGFDTAAPNIIADFARS